MKMGSKFFLVIVLNTIAKDLIILSILFRFRFSLLYSKILFCFKNCSFFCSRKSFVISTEKGKMDLVFTYFSKAKKTQEVVFLRLTSGSNTWKQGQSFPIASCLVFTGRI